VRYDCSSPAVARRINCLAKKVGLTDSDFKPVVQTTPEQRDRGALRDLILGSATRERERLDCEQALTPDP
jgi:hypothetical protein